MSFDIRTRIDGQDPVVSPRDLFESVLPERFGAMRERLAPAVRGYALRPLTIEVDGESWSLAATEEAISVRRGAGDGRLRIGLESEQVADLVRDQATPFTWFAGGTLRLEGNFQRLLDWWLFIRGALDGTVPHLPGALDVEKEVGEHGLRRSFHLGEDVDGQRSFLAHAGFLHLAGVFSETEMAAVSADMDVAAPGYQPGDGRSWWARTADGTNRLVRMQGFDDVSRTVAALVADERLRRIGEIPGAGHVWGGMKNNRIEALIKPLAVTEGISDVPWHKDCSLGRHSYDCCSVTVGISVTGADARSGQLRVVAGSHRALVWPAHLRADLDLPQVDLPTRTGDVTLHLSCTLHMAQPPVERERRVLYTSFRLPARSAAAGDERARLIAVRERAHTTVSQPSAAGTPASR